MFKMYKVRLYFPKHIDYDWTSQKTKMYFMDEEGNKQIQTVYQKYDKCFALVTGLAMEHTSTERIIRTEKYTIIELTKF